VMSQLHTWFGPVARCTVDARVTCVCVAVGFILRNPATAPHRSAYVLGDLLVRDLHG